MTIKIFTKKICVLLVFLSSYQVKAINDASPNGAMNVEPDIYQELKKANNNNRLFFNNERLNLSGMTLLSLLADLGVREYPELSVNERRDVNKTDSKLTLTLYRFSKLKDGHQLKQVNTLDNIKMVINENILSEYIDNSIPHFNEVIRLRSAINKHKKMRAVPWPQLSETFNPKLGQGHNEVNILRKQLRMYGDLAKSNVSSKRQHIFDPEIVNALKNFQQRNGLTASGGIDETTRQLLNKSTSERLKILQANLWRWLSLPKKPPDKYLLVNIPSYNLSLIEEGKSVLGMKVIVGKESNPTPIMVTDVSRITVNPTWTPTYNIVQNELLPLHKRNPNALRQQNFFLAKGYGSQIQYREILKNDPDLQNLLKQYRLVQAPGRNNALGNVRFNIKNNHYVFLHDTPAKSLFRRQNRALSHGCVRLENADFLLDQLLLSEPQATRNLAKTAAESKSTQNITLSSPIPVFVTYQTAWVDDKGIVNWRPDLYRLDNSQPNATVSN